LSERRKGGKISEAIGDCNKHLGAMDDLMLFALKVRLVYKEDEMIDEVIIL
jgi:hypothetical protein